MGKVKTERDVSGRHFTFSMCYGIHGLSAIARRGPFIRVRSNLYTVAARIAAPTSRLRRARAQEDVPQQMMHRDLNFQQV